MSNAEWDGAFPNWDDDWEDYREVFGQDPEPWREPLGALRLTLTGHPDTVDVERAQHEVEWLTRVLNRGYDAN